MNSKLVRVHIEKKAFVSSGFSWSNYFGLTVIRTWTDDLVRVHLSKFSPSFFIRENCPNELGPNHQPISDQINHGPSSYRPKLLLHENPLEINAFLSIWTRTIFEFIYALACITLTIGLRMIINYWQCLLVV